MTYLVQFQGELLTTISSNKIMSNAIAALAAIAARSRSESARACDIVGRNVRFLIYPATTVGRPEVPSLSRESDNAEWKSAITVSARCEVN